MDTFLVYDPEDRFHASICYGKDEAIDVVSMFGVQPPKLRIWRITPEHMSVDVTLDFVPDDEPVEDLIADREWSAADRRHQERMEGVRRC